MGLFIGNINTSGNYTLSNETLENDRADARGKDAPIYGVVFDPSGKNPKGQRLYDAKGLNFSPSVAKHQTSVTLETAGVDDFITLSGVVNKKGQYCQNPFEIYTHGTWSTNSYDDDNHLSLSKNGANYSSFGGSYPLYVCFPKFYYCRPQKWEFLVSPRYLPGFLPSPMHYRNGHMYKYAYVSKYSLNVASPYQSSYDSTSGAFQIKNIIDRSGNYFKYSASGAIDKTGAFRALFNLRYSSKAAETLNTACPLDYQSLCMIYFLMYIKYNTMCVSTWDPYHHRAYFLDAQSTTALDPIAPKAAATGTTAGWKKNMYTLCEKNSVWKQDGIGYTHSGKNMTGAVYQTLGLVGLIGERLLLSGAFVSDKGLQIYDLNRYYAANRPLEDPDQVEYINENLQSDSWNNYEISTKSDSPLVSSSQYVSNIGYSPNAPWAIYPAQADSETNSNKFYLEDPNTQFGNQFKMFNDLTTPTANYVIHNGMLPNLTGARGGNSKTGASSLVEFTSATVRSYYVSD